MLTGVCLEARDGLRVRGGMKACGCGMWVGLWGVDERGWTGEWVLWHGMALARVDFLLFLRFLFLFIAAVGWAGL